MPRPVIFDLDGVLVDSEPLYEAAFRRYVRVAGHPELAGWFENTLGRRQPDIAAELGEKLDQPGLDVAEGLTSALERVLEQTELEPMPFAVDAIHLLRSGERPLGLASSSSGAFIRGALGATGLVDSFDAIATGDEARNGKPHPEIYLLAADRLGVVPSTCIAVEDTPVGVAAARAAGMTVVAVPNDLTRELDFEAADIVEQDLEQAARSILRLDAVSR